MAVASLLRVTLVNPFQAQPHVRYRLSDDEHLRPPCGRNA